MKKRNKIFLFLSLCLSFVLAGGIITTQTLNCNDTIQTRADTSPFLIIFTESNYTYNLNPDSNGNARKPVNVKLTITSGSVPANTYLDIGYESQLSSTVITIEKVSDLEYNVSATDTVNVILYIYLYDANLRVVGKYSSATFRANHLILNETWETVLVSLIPWALFILGIVIIVLILSRKKRSKVQQDLSGLCDQLIKINKEQFDKINKEENEKKKKFLLIKLLAIDKSSIAAIAILADETVSDVTPDANEVLKKARVAVETINAINKLPFNKQTINEQYKLLSNFYKIVILDLKDSIDLFESVWNAYLDYRETIKLETRGPNTLPIQISFKSRADYKNYLEKKDIYSKQDNDNT